MSGECLVGECGKSDSEEGKRVDSDALECDHVQDWLLINSDFIFNYDNE